MSWLSDFQDLVDLVEEQPGWRVTSKGRGVWSIYPPDQSAEIIHCNASADVRSLDNFKARLRRAGFPPLMRTKNVPKELPPDKPAPSPAPAHRDLIAEARGHISGAIDCLSKLEGVLGEMAVERADVLQIKELFQRLGK